ncbi:hypothetical protein [Streptantibioticus silvisoli]|uniref:Uncharacterized protein n=1 Tax=Streptantibioticus silvisoli TaxID=2705255 RepID=A0ABT6W7V9_9ACTN|nr:hypothetical protein [Streptantibioticus silvisoli]MDI5965763.1 hypothetical protein [Streptantibioticus silvisoli]
MNLFGSGPAPMLAAEEQQRGDNLAARIVELQLSGQSVAFHQQAAQDAYGNAAQYTVQPEGRP